MKNRLVKILSLLLAGSLQIMPMIRSMLPTLAQGPMSSTWAIIFRWGAGAAAYMGYHAISSASSIAISPGNMTNGVPYVGTVTYAGGHSGSVKSMSLTNICLGSATSLGNGLSIIYNGGNTATVSGTPTTTNSISFTLKMLDASNCTGAGNTDTRTTTLAGNGGGAPAFAAVPQSLTAQLGSDALFSAAATGNPTPKYLWYLGAPALGGTLVSTSNTLYIPSIQLANAGLYTVIASNGPSQTAQATAYLSVVITPGTNQLALNYTNYGVAGRAVTMTSLITNAPSGVHSYLWDYNFINQIGTSSSFTLPIASANAAHSGTYSVTFGSTVGSTIIATNQLYYSYWSFGTAPIFLTQPQPTNVAPGSTVTLTASAYIAQTPITNHATTFLWYLNGTTLLTNQTDIGTNISVLTTSFAYSNAVASLTLPNVTALNAGSYTVVATNYWGSITSAPATLTVSSSSTPPSFATQPAPLSVLVGQNASFGVSVTGTAPFSYQWQKDSVNLANSGTYSGVNTNVLVLTGVATTNAGSYSVLVSNAAGSTNSSSAALSVSQPPGLTLSSGATSLQISATTVTGLSYVVQSATNLTAPWIPVATNTVPGTGILLFTNPLGNQEQYFRLRFP